MQISNNLKKEPHTHWFKCKWHLQLWKQDIAVSFLQVSLSLLVPFHHSFITISSWWLFYVENFLSNQILQWLFWRKSMFCSIVKITFLSICVAANVPKRHSKGTRQRYKGTCILGIHYQQNVWRCINVTKSFKLTINKSWKIKQLVTRPKI